MVVVLLVVGSGVEGAEAGKLTTASGLSDLSEYVKLRSETVDRFAYPLFFLVVANMQYRTFLKNSDDRCPFCEEGSFDPTVLVYETARARVTIPKAPYVADQLLIMPKAHVVNFADLSLLDAFHCFRLLRWAGKQLYRQGHKGYVILLRDGDKVDKSIPHLHIHVIPDTFVEAKNSSINRKVLTKAEIVKRVKAFLNIKSKK